jgi:hypothetical protein
MNYYPYEIYPPDDEIIASALPEIVLHPKNVDPLVPAQPILTS